VWTGDRIYVTGLSMGGAVTWTLACRYPELMAAAVPICGWGNTGLAAAMKELPTWAFHGTADTTILPQSSIAMVDAVNNAGGKALLTLYSGVGHDCWTQTYQDPALYSWLFEQHKLHVPTLSLSPTSISSALGAQAVLSAEVQGSDLRYRWTRNGVEVSGANASILKIPAVTYGDAGVYQAEISNAKGTIRTEAATLQVGTAIDVPRLAALSVRANAGRNDNTLIIGVSLSNESPTSYPTQAEAPRLPVLMRGLGPALRSTELTQTIPNPKLSLFKAQDSNRSNDNWENSALVTLMTSKLMLQTLSADSLDSGMVEGLLPGSYTMHVSPSGQSTEGIALAEFYECNGGLTQAAPRLRALSARGLVTPGDGALIVGFIITGPGPLKILVRALGPAMNGSGLSHLLGDPVLRIYAGQQKIFENDDCENSAALVQTTAGLGLTPLQTGAKDAALIARLEPGAYTAIISTKGGESGIALAQFYSIDE
jgi:hypothetical protein